MPYSKKTMTAALAVILAGSVASQAFAADGFKDLQGVKNAAQIESLRDRGVIQGVKDGIFAPAEEITAAEGITLIVNALRDKLGLETVKLAGPSSYFTKVSDKAWYAFAFSVAHYKGIDLPKDIDPNKALTKEEFVFYLQQAIEATGGYPLIKIYIHIADEDALTTLYQGAIQRSLIMKISELDTAGKFNPKTILTRAEAATYAYQALTFVETHKSLEYLEQEQAKDPYQAEAELTGGSAIYRIVRDLELSFAAIDFSSVPLPNEIFPKVSNDAFYADALVIAHGHGVELPESFDPSKPLTREEFTFYLQQALEKSRHYPLIKIVPASIADESDMTAGYQGAIQRSLKMGITELNKDGKFLPKALITQQEAADLLQKAVDYATAHPDTGIPSE
ncbi:S-layer homology domain-containing protein [Gorillibacterium timonense]|uniref:S-layer homology domain-containing protein n=1 Tax=Gorillibacterium timonense TaxID=1689269 RepID=UPI00071CC082|nr:S-layer homology domain-containing protein [Gorillibacterium timonense]